MVTTSSFYLANLGSIPRGPTMQCKKCDEGVVNSGLCRAHYNEKMRAYMLERYHRRRAEFVSEWGGKCIDCGTTDSLEFDHADASSKLLDVGKLFTSYTDSKIRAELDKCVLRCTDCHIIKSRSEDWETVGHGEGISGKRNCPCDLCRTKKSDYNRAYRLRKLEQKQ